ncbi:MAG: hypothetical protein KGO02_08135 [Alphaproteobacteria bacterium]|nr:hypothetical protein [Alphaproteobacteria bacterium]
MHEEKPLSSTARDKLEDKLKKHEILQQNITRMELLLEILEKTIIVGGFRYFALHTHQVVLNSLSVAAVLILGYYTSLRLAEAIWVPISFELRTIFRLEEKHQIKITLVIGMAGFIAWYVVFYDALSVLTKTHF